MGAHRRRQPPGRAKIAVISLTAAGATALGSGVGNAEPKPTIDQIKAQVDQLYEEAEAATEQYNAVQDRQSALQRESAAIQERTAAKQTQLARLQDGLGALAAAQYRSGGIDPTLQLILSADPSEYLQRAASLNAAGARQSDALNQVREARRQLDQDRAELGAKLAEAERTRTELAAKKKQVEGKLAEVQKILNGLKAEERAKVLEEEAAAQAKKSPAAPAAGATTAKPPAGQTYNGPATGRVKAALDFAYAQLGKPYVWGATGPESYDCSGLTGAIWRAAGVSLPRTSQQQYAAGRKVAKADLQPGDLVFFYDDLHHVGFYIGNGQMIDAPRPGKSVQITGIDTMPYAGATRP